MINIQVVGDWEHKQAGNTTMKTLIKTEKALGRRDGFTMPEILLVVAVMGLVGAFGLSAVHDVRGSAEKRKLVGNVETLNRAVKVYMASGGSLTEAMAPQEVIDKLKTVARDDQKDLLPTLRGSMVDPRLRAIMQTSKEAGESARRAVWDGRLMRFRVIRSGEAGIKRFVLDDGLAAAAVVEELRGSSMKLAKEDGWIWDYTDRAPVQSAAMSRIPVRHTVNEVTPSYNLPDPTRLTPPEFSLEGGKFSYKHDMIVRLEDPNWNKPSRVLYRVNDGAWRIYGGEEISLMPGRTGIETYAVSLSPDAWGDSATVEEVYRMEKLRFAGSTDGEYKNPEGGRKMVTNLNGSESGDYFEWGRAAKGDPSWLTFEGAEFADVEAGDEFLLGSINYFNGTIYSGTGAGRVDLAVSFDLSMPWLSETFEFSLELINTANRKHQSDDENADFVRLGDVAVDLTTQLNGEDYRLELSFGQSGEFGFTSIDQFHVHEGRSAWGDLMGRFVLDSDDVF